MYKSQPVSNDKKILDRLGLSDILAEERAADRTVVKVEHVDEMFDFSDKKISLTQKILGVFRRLKLKMEDRRRGLKNYRRFKDVLENYYPYSTYSFLRIFMRHLETYINFEKKYGISEETWKEHKITTAQEAIDIMNRLVDDDYYSKYTAPVMDKWGKLPYEKITYENGDKGFKHLTPEGYDEEIRAA
ncbi:MAG: hypothetical protein LBM60_05825, partial [Clostridium sp.]|nr:hypothetical protein [Clostridium sp.]